MGKFKDLTGKTYGRLKALKIDEEKTKETKLTYWICECSCEEKTIKSLRAGSLNSGNVKSCGCLAKESKTRFQPVHGLKKHWIFNVWRGMKKRCYYKNNKCYKNYGGRGIKVYDGWINDVKSFHDYVLKLDNYGKDGYSLDRINNNGNYEPGNIKWSTNEEQSQNKRSNIVNAFTVKEIRKLFSEYSDIEIAEKFNLNRRYINHLRNNEIWKNI